MWRSIVFELVKSLPKLLQAFVVLAAVVVVVGGGIMVAFIVFGDPSRSITFGTSGIQVSAHQDPRVIECHERAQALSAGEQRASSDILALEAQVSAKERDLAETRQKCAAAVTAEESHSQFSIVLHSAGDGPAWNACAVPGREERLALTGWNEMFRAQMRQIADEIAYEREEVAAIREAQRQEHQRLDEQCPGVATQVLAASHH
jgi:hypothetical protein